VKAATATTLARTPSAKAVEFADHEEIIRAAVSRHGTPVIETVPDRPETADFASPRFETPTALRELKVIDLPEFRAMDNVGSSMAAMQEWEGVVTAVEGDTIYADLIDITANRRHADETAEIPLGEFQIEDRPMVKRGTVFRWAIGYLKTEAGTRVGGSVLRLRHTSAIVPAIATQRK
jgi:hypothetical protein